MQWRRPDARSPGEIRHGHDLEQLGASGGTGAHKHDVTLDLPRKGVAAVKGLVTAKTQAVKSVGVSVKKSGDHTHPHVRLVYIMRL